MFIIIILTIHCVKSQWSIRSRYLYQQMEYQYSEWCNQHYYYTEYFCKASDQSITANFITCKQPSMSYITLDNTYSSIASFYSNTYLKGDFISFDLYFQVFEFGSFQYSFEYTSPDQYPITEGFCDTIQTDVRTVNFTLPSQQSGHIKFRQTNTNAGSVSIRMITISRIICYPSCSSCTGPEQNQCQSCYYGVPTNNICPPCPNNQYYEKYEGCRTQCRIENLKILDGFCFQFYQSVVQIYDNSISQSSKLKWQQLYDPLHLDTSPSYNNIGGYGIFKHNSGIGRLIDEISTSTIIDTYGIRITLMLFNHLELGRGIRFMIIGIIEFNDSNKQNFYKSIIIILTIVLFIEIHKGSKHMELKLPNILHMVLTAHTLKLQLQNSICLLVYLYINFTFQPLETFRKIIIYLRDSSVGWGLRSLSITTGVCPQWCKICEYILLM